MAQNTHFGVWVCSTEFYLRDCAHPMQVRRGDGLEGGLWALGLSSRSEEGLRGPRIASLWGS